MATMADESESPGAETLIEQTLVEDASLHSDGTKDLAAEAFVPPEVSPCGVCGRTHEDNVTHAITWLSAARLPTT